jgi:uncharacterized protein (UPF0332 family)
VARFADPVILQRVAVADARLVKAWKEGVSLEARSGHTLGELQQRVSTDRLALAAELLSRGRRLTGANPPRYRDAISRFYYAAYHAFRSVVYYSTGGDDHEQHSVLPTRIPPDFPSRTLRSNDLKSAREIRNSADYDMYPKADSAWKHKCQTVQIIAEESVRDARAYLRLKGCKYV